MAGPTPFTTTVVTKVVSDETDITAPVVTTKHTVQSPTQTTTTKSTVQNPSQTTTTKTTAQQPTVTVTTKSTGLTGGTVPPGGLAGGLPGAPMAAAIPTGSPAPTTGGPAGGGVVPVAGVPAQLSVILPPGMGTEEVDVTTPSITTTNETDITIPSVTTTNETDVTTPSLTTTDETDTVATTQTTKHIESTTTVTTIAAGTNQFEHAYWRVNVGAKQTVIAFQRYAATAIFAPIYRLTNDEDSSPVEVLTDQQDGVHTQGTFSLMPGTSIDLSWENITVSNSGDQPAHGTFQYLSSALASQQVQLAARAAAAAPAAGVWSAGGGGPFDPIFFPDPSPPDPAPAPNPIPVPAGPGPLIPFDAGGDGGS